VQEGRRVKSLDLPGGTVRLRARQPELALDEVAAVAWAREQRLDVIRVRHSLDKSALRKAVELVDGGAVIDASTGEVLPFMTWSPQGDSVSFTPAGAADESGGAA
jgi:phage host-nuclease inhibitor protein Gam